MDNDSDRPDLSHLERRMHFVLGPKHVESPTNWRKYEVAGGGALSAHPELNVTTVSAEGKVLTLLGFVLDPDAPTATDADVLKGLIRRLSEGRDLHDQLAALGGRYVLIVDDGTGADQVKVVGDASAALQLVYTRVDGDTWCAAQPDTLADLFGFVPEPEAVAFIESQRAAWDEYFWPVDSSPYAEVRRLLPNFFLSLNTGTVHRYWPNEPLAERSVAEVVGPVGQRLSGLMHAAAHRFELSMGVSCGLDSRLMLAASRAVTDKMVFYTSQSKKRNARHPDVYIPQAMLNEIGAEHHLIVSNDEVSTEFAEMYARNAPYAHAQRAPSLERQHARYRLGRVAVIGNTSENARGIYTSSKTPIPVGGMSPAYCARISHLLVHPFAERHFGRWIEELGELHGYDPRELLFWESRSGSWFAGNVMEFLSAWRDVFLPFNCRALLLDLMAAPLSTRARPATELYEAVIGDLWPELLRYPINPVSRGARLRKQTYLVLRRVKRRLLGNAPILVNRPG